MPVLPISRAQNDAPGGKRRSGQRVSSGDVPIIASRTPGALNVDRRAFESTLGIASKELAPGIADVGAAAQRLQEAEVKQQNREATVDRSDKINKYGEAINAELQRVNDEGDLSNKDDLEAYGAFLSEKQAEFLEGHNFSEDSKVKLTVRMQDLSSNATGRAAGISAALGEQKAKNMFNGTLAPLATSVAQDPSKRNIDRQFLSLNTVVDDVAGAFDPTEEAELFRTGREHISLTALNSLIDSGRGEQAEALLGDPTIINSLSPQTQRTIRKKLQTVKTSKNELLQKFRTSEEILGRPMTPEERSRFLKIDPKGQAQNVRQQKIDGIVKQGVSIETATAITDGNVKIIGPDLQGRFSKVNKVTDEVTLLDEGDSAVIAEAVAKEGQGGSESTTTQTAQATATQPEPTKPSLKEAVGEGVGVVSNIQAGLSNVFGFMFDDAIQKDTTDARQRVRLFSKTAQRALSNNPKFPVAEMKIIQDMLPDTAAFFKDPKTAVSDLGILKETLEGMQESKLKELTKKLSGVQKLTSKRKGELADGISTINEILDLMEEPEAQPLPEGIEEGSQLVGQSKNGFDVYQSPDGRQFEVTPDEGAENPTTPKNESTDSRTQETPESQDLERIVQLFDDLEADPDNEELNKKVVNLLITLEKKLGIEISDDFIKKARKKKTKRK